MTVDALPERVRRRTRKNQPPPIAIGESDANIVGCPACYRPLDAGARSCPSCGTHIIAGVRATKALTFAAIGLAIGLAVGTTVTGGIALVAMATGSTSPVDAGVVPGNGTTDPTGGTGMPPAAVITGVPSAALSAFQQAAELNQRLTVDRARLVAALEASKPSAAELARILRTINANATFGVSVTPQLARWDLAGGVATDLELLYADIGATARDGLSASITNSKSYIRTAKAVAKRIAGLASIDEVARPLAAQAGVVLKPLDPAAAP